HDVLLFNISIAAPTEIYALSLHDALPILTMEGDRFRVVGPRVERWVAEADLDDARQVVDLQRRLVRAGVERRLQEAGARRGDEVLIGGTTFEFIPEGEVRTSGAGADGSDHDDGDDDDQT